ncbi:MAG: rhamnulokinase [Lentisphaerae bacterium]|nr:rhamnulokinase [Lentisphaerota bacterium]
MKKARLFAVDLGASGGKCFAGTIGRGGFSMREVHRFPHEGVTFRVADAKGRLAERAHWDDTLLYRNILLGLEEFGRSEGRSLDSIGIDTWGADGQMMTADGDPLGKMYCYRDHRLDRMVDEVKKRMAPERIYGITGVHFQPFNVSNQLLWFMQNRGGWLNPGCFYLPVPSLFYYYLGGARCVDSSWASVTQLMDARRHCWSGEILRALGIPKRIMPRIVEPGAKVGRLHAGLASAAGVSRAALVAVASHDTASAFAAAPVSDPAEALVISSGTWSLVGKLVANPITSEAAMACNISNEGGIGNTRFLKNCMGTWLVQELRRVWRTKDGREPAWSVLDQMTEKAPAFTAFVDPDDTGFYNPADMEKAIAAFCRRTRQKVPADRGTFLRVVYESLALKYRLVNEQICAACNGRTKVVHIVGGGSRNMLLNQFAADCLGLPVLAGPEEATAVGNMMVQAMGMGVIRSMADAQPLIRKAFPIRTYKPRDPGAWEQAYARFRGICGV